VSGQWLVSESKTPNRPDLAAEWTGQTLDGHAGVVQWSHNTTHLDWFGLYRDVSSGFRADVGFVPQVGYREIYGQTGWTFRPTGFLSRLRTFVNVDRQIDYVGALVSRDVQPGVVMDTAFNGFIQFRYIQDKIRTPGGMLIGRQQFGYTLQFGPSRQISQVAINGTLGQDIDFDNSRRGRGPTVNVSATLDPTEHVELALIENLQWLNVDDPAGESRRLFTARVSRLRGTYTFTARTFVRVIGQYVSTDSDPMLYLHTVTAHVGTFNGSALFAYRLNWQSVIYVGYGDDRELSDQRRLLPSDRQMFVKMSYAFQR
jgi:hypothetical protein